MAPPAAPVTGQGTFLFERELFTHCLSKEVFIKLKQVSEIIRKLKKIILV